MDESTKASRKEFEQWFKTKFSHAEEHLSEGKYGSDCVQTAWLSWQASRQALDIALPVLEQQESPTDRNRKIKNDGWIEWSGGEIPVAENMVVRVRYRGDFQEDKCLAGSMIWEHSGEEDDIIAYRVIEND